MKTSLGLNFFFSLLLGLSGCSKEDTTTPVIPQPEEPTKTLVVPIINEASGIVDSKTAPGHLWVQEDSGNPAQLYLLSHNGAVLKKIPLKGAKNRDWEDMALFGDQVYLADIGDNNKTAKEYAFYIFKEPSPTTDTIRNVSVIKYKYSDGSHDSEAFLIDPKTRDILIITKTDTLSRVYKLTYPFSSTALNTAKLVGNLPYSYVVSAAVSPNGKEAIVKTYAAIYHYEQKGTKPMEEYLLKEYNPLPYTIEPQGEAVAFSAAETGYFTLSEKGLASAVNLYFYKKK
ncbi:SdiA-regulated/phytase-like domain-containing protein [Rufibacter hautae]|uniref:PE-PGRS family protein n=1 Tax=Rufibacter hautae TaxID=2595005 RepID=A0A5B6T7S9_9BACT|nr:hypothetical protein [Rufibacter hautae]KAA3436075.1 hypothetical protein FOA19_16865 [Rufibacter hautae]